MTKKNSNSFTQNDYEIIERDVPYEGIFRMARYKLRFRLFNHKWSDPIVREVMERNPSVGVLLYDPKLDSVILIEQFRAGALANPQSPWLIEIVAGIVDTNEKPADVAKREAIEESGCEILDLYPICGYFASPGGCNEFIHLFCGRVDANHAGGIYGLLEHGENIRAFSIPVEKAFIMLQENKIMTSPAFITLQWLQLNREWLKQLWQTK